MTSGRSTRRSGRRRFRRLRRVTPWQWLGGLAVLVLLGAGALFAYQGARAILALDDARAQSSLLLKQLAAGQVAAARGTTTSLQTSTQRAHDLTSGPLWAVATKVPIVGDDVDAMRTVSREIDLIADDALPPVIDVASQLNVNAFTPRSGRIDLKALRTARPAAAQADRVLGHASRELASIDVSGLLGRLQQPVRQLRASIDSSAFAASAAHDASQLLPSMLGGSGTKRYLLVVQNNAEVRSTGGLPGSISVVTARNGRLQMDQQGSAATIGQLSGPAATLTRDERSIFSTAMTTDFRDTNFTPDYPRAAQIMAAMATERFGQRFDGVIALDPVTLSYLLDGIGPITLDDGTRLTTSNAVDVLLHDVYVKYAKDPAAQDAVFADTARRIFDAFVGGAANAQKVLDGLVQAGRENRLLVWSRDRPVEATLQQTGLAGQLPRGGTAPAVGVYLNDSTGAKMQWYLETRSELASEQCLDGDRQRLTLRTLLVSGAPVDAAKLLPKSVTGSGDPFKRGSQGINVRFFAPSGGTIDSITIDGKQQTIAGGSLDGRQVAVVPVTLKADTSLAITVRMTSGRGQPGRAVLSTTPSLDAAVNDQRSASACS